MSPTLLRRCLRSPIGVPVLFLLVLQLAGAPRAARAQDGDAGIPLTAAMLESLSWRNIGPAISSGRIVDLAVPEQDKDVIYAASASGGLWKSVNRGTTWTPVFERERTVSIGAIAVAPSNPHVVWVGTGEANNQRSSSWGDGVYKSDDGGKTWHHMGLGGSQHVGGFAIDPRDENVVFVAALGPLWGSGEERGLFRSTDGGETWDKVLYVGEHTGVVDVVMDPRDPDRIFAAAYQRERRNWSFVGGGPEGGVYLSEDGGGTWRQLRNGLPDPDVGKIGFAISPSNPDVVYAVIEAQERSQTGLYRSADGGASWEHRSTNNPIPWYYSQVRVDPHDPDRVYMLGTTLSVSDDGGATWNQGRGAPGIHVDHHALWIDPDDGSHMVIGNDGGVAITWDRGASWDFVANLPVTQFYHIGVDMRSPFYYVCGGTQDNNTWCGPSGTRNEDGIVNDDWYVTVGGDGFYAQVDPTDANVVYSESQNGNLVRFNPRTGERKFIQPQPPEGERYRWNWSSPVVISDYDPKIIYFAANRVFRSDGRGDGWEVISPDLTRQLDRDELPLMGRNWPRNAVSRHSGVSEYGNITTLDASPFGPDGVMGTGTGVLAAGTDDGIIAVTRDDGATWVRIESFEGIPEMTRVSRLEWSHHVPGRLYAAFDAHKDNDFRPYLLRTDDYGASWTDITGDLPEFGSTRVVREHLSNPDFLAAGTEFGLFVTLDGGEHWVQLKNNLPTVAVHDIVFHPRDGDLVIGTHGRGIWILDDVTILQELTPEQWAAGAHLATVLPAIQFNQFDRGRDAQGARYYRAENPPRGAVLTWFLADEALQTEGKGKAEVRLEILDERGEPVRRLEVEAQPGIRRAVWDLRHEPPYRADPPQGGQGGFFGGGAPRGPWVMPGVYTARLTAGDTVLERPVDVVIDTAVAVSREDLQARHDLAVQVAAMQATLHAASTTLEQLQETVGAIDKALASAAGAPAELVEEAKRIGKAIRDAQTAVRGGGFPPNPDIPPGIQQVLGRLAGTLSGYTGAPGPTEGDAAARAGERLAELVATVNRIQQEELPALNARLDAAGIPWTPGRTIR